jgi:hypothetical protein
MTAGDPAPVVPGEARSQKDSGIVSCGSIISTNEHAPFGQEPVQRLSADLRNDACDNARSLRLFGLVLMGVAASAMVLLGCVRGSTGVRTLLVRGAAAVAVVLFVAGLWLAVFARSSG